MTDGLRVEEAAAFLGALYGRAPEGCVEVRPFAPAWADAGVRAAAPKWRAWLDVGSLDGVARVAASADAASLDVYVGVAARRARGGTAHDVVAVTALWAELDGSVSKKGNGCTGKEAALDRLSRVAVPPSIVVDSGGGLHCYWLLDAPVTGERLKSVPLWNARVREMLRGPDGTHAGDDVGDLARILRLPGTWNRKLQDAPRPVRLLQCDADCLYSLDWLDGELPVLPQVAFSTAPAARGEARPEMAADPERRAVLVAAAASEWAKAEGQRHFLPHPMARVLLQGGWPWQDIPAVIRDIAMAAGSVAPNDRAASAAKELGHPAQGRELSGWPWLRREVPGLAQVLQDALAVRTDDLAAIADHARKLAAPSPVVDMPVAAAVREAVRVAGIAAPAVAGYMAAQYGAAQGGSVASGATGTGPGTAIPPAAPATAAASVTQLRGGNDGEQARAAERIYNLLRDRLDWIGVNAADARPYGGRRRLEYNGTVTETVALDGREAEHWCLDVVRAAGLPLTETNRNVALDMLRADARHSKVALSLRYARDAGGILVDLGTADWTAVRVTPRGWHVEPQAAPSFVRSACTGAMALPEVLAEPGDLPAGLREVLRCEDGVADRLACWMVQALLPDAPRMGLFVTGPQGSGKSTLARCVRRIIDPAKPDLLKFTISKRSEVDYQTANVHKSVLACVAYSNVSSMNEGASDFLCGLITGDGHIARALYSDADPVLSEGRRVLIMEGIAVLGMGADLQDRLLHLSLPVREGFEPESRMLERMERALPLMQGALFSALSRALELLPSIEERYGPVLDRCRMRDAAAVYAAAAEAMGMDAAWMLDQLVTERADAQGAEAESDVVGQKLLQYLEARGKYTTMPVVSDSPQEYLQEQLGSMEPKVPDAWPRTPRAFRARLERLVPGMRAKGWNVEFYRSIALDRKSCIRISRV